MNYNDAYKDEGEDLSSFRPIGMTTRWRHRRHKRWFGLFPDVFVMQVELYGTLNLVAMRVWQDASEDHLKELGFPLPVE